MARLEIDERVSRLVHALDDIDSVQTFSSCGGHEEPKPGQTEEGTFYVNFYLDWEKGEDDLVKLCFAAAHFLGKEDEPGEFGVYAGTATVVPWWNGDVHEFFDGRGCLCFEIRGNCNPDVLAAKIREVTK